MVPFPCAQWHFRLIQQSGCRLGEKDDTNKAAVLSNIMEISILRIHLMVVALPLPAHFPSSRRVYKIAEDVFQIFIAIVFNSTIQIFWTYCDFDALKQIRGRLDCHANSHLLKLWGKCYFPSGPIALVTSLI